MMQASVLLRSLARCCSNASSCGSKVGVGYLSTQAAPSLQEPCESPNDSIDWNNLGFGLVKTDYMYTMKSANDEPFKQGKLNPFGKIELSPSAGVLNYGQGIFEGTKCYRREDGGLFLFRPQQNAIRMQIGAERMCMPSPSVDQFIDAVKQTALSNQRWIPPPGKGSLYIRPLLIGSGAILGFEPAPEYTFLVYASPVGIYFKQLGTSGLNLYVEDEFHRAMNGGAGGIKSITNYAPALKAIKRAKKNGFSDVLYLDSLNKRNVEEASSSNVFIVKGNTLSTPAPSGTILEGVTRKSIMEIARDLGYQVEERSIPIEELLDADEVFCTGTAAGVAPVGSVTYKGQRTEYKRANSELACLKFFSRLTEIQKGTIEDKRGWVVQIS